MSTGEEVEAGAGARPRRGGIPGAAAGPYCDNSSRLKYCFCSWFELELFADTIEQFVSITPTPLPQVAGSEAR